MAERHIGIAGKLARNLGLVADEADRIGYRYLSRHTIWHARAMLRFLRKHPERLLALR